MTAITTAQLTEVDLEGVGVFDKLMKASTVHLDREHKLGRIKGTEYSQVYLGMMQANLAQAVQFLLTREKAGHEADLVQQQVINAAKEHEVLHATKCKLDAEYDVLLEQKLKVIAETALLGQKKETETAQINGANVVSDSVIGHQTALYAAQTAGFEKDSQQKAAKLMVDAFSVRSTTKPDETEGNPSNNLDDPAIGKVIAKMAEGVGITV
jgi:hypothetical protein